MVLVMKGAVRVSSGVCVRERQLDGRTGEVVLRNGAIWVSLALWV